MSPPRRPASPHVAFALIAALALAPAPALCAQASAGPADSHGPVPGPTAPDGADAARRAGAPLAEPGPLAGEAPLKVGYYDARPSCWRDATGRPRGFFVDAARAFAEARGLAADFRYGGWEELLRALAAGDIDMLLCIADTAARREYALFSSESVITDWGGVFARPGSRIESVLDLEGRKVAVLDGDFWFEGPGCLRDLLSSFGVGASFVRRGDYTSVFEAVDSGAADACVASNLLGLYLGRRGAARATPIIFAPTPLKVAFPRASPRSAALRAAFDAYISGGKADPSSRFAAILDSYLIPVQREYLKPAWADSAPWIGLVAFAALAAFLLVQTLRLRVNSRRRKESLSRFELAIRASNGVIWDWDVASASMKFFGNTAAFLHGVDLSDRPWAFADLLEGIHPDDRDAVAAFGDPAGIPESAILEVRMLSFPPDGALGAPEDYVKWVRIEGSVVERTREGAPARIAGSIVDITRLKNNERALRSSLRQKEEFLHEIHHRVKNNLQLMLSILNLQEGGVGSEEAVSALREAKGRIHAISLIQDELYDRREGSIAEFAGYLAQIFERARSLHKAEGATFAMAPTAIQGAVDLEVILPVAIAVNEAFTNSLLHGAGPAGACAVRAVLERDGPLLSLLIEDGGPGIPPDARKGLGLDLMESLIASVRGRFEVLPGPGTRIRMRFPATLK